MRGVLPNEDLRAYPGLFARIRVENKVLPDALLVEEKAIGADLAGKYVLVVGDGSMVERRGVELGPKSGQLQAILSGLSTDDTYIVEGMVRARPGLPVRTETREKAQGR